MVLNLLLVVVTPLVEVHQDKVIQRMRVLIYVVTLPLVVAIVFLEPMEEVHLKNQPLVRRPREIIKLTQLLIR